MSMMFFLPNILLSGFMFPFAGMPTWARWIGEGLPLTHYLRIVRAIMLKGATLRDVPYDAGALFALMLLAMAIAVLRFRRTLDRGAHLRISHRQGRGRGAMNEACEPIPMSVMNKSMAPDDARHRARTIGFLNWGHLLDHYVLLIYPTVILGFGL